MKKTAILLMLLMTFMSSVCIAGMWGYLPRPYEEVKVKFSNVIVLNIDGIHSRKRYKHYANGKTTLFQETLLIDGTIQRQLYGKLEAIKLKLIFISRPPVLYDANGEMVLGALDMSARSGVEFKANIGESYIFSFESLAKQEARYHYTRMDDLENEKAIKLVLSNYQ